MMRFSFLIFAVGALGPAAAFAQDFELDLGFDDGIVFEEASVALDEPDAPVDEDLSADMLSAGDAFEIDLASVSEPETGLPDIKLNLSYAKSDGPGGNTDSTAASIILTDSHDLGALGFLEWEASVDVDDPAGAADVSASLDRIKLQNSSGQLSWAVGKFPIGWGEIEGTPVLDILNAGLSLDTIGTDTDDLPGQWVATLEYFGDPFTLSAFAGLDPEVSYGVASSAPSDEMEIGVRAMIPVEQGQVAAYVGRLVPQSAVIASDGSDSIASAFTLVGLSAHRVFGPVLVEADIAAKFGLDRATATGFAKDDRLDAAIGLEYALSNTTQITANVSAQYWKSGGAGYFDFGPAGPMAAKRLNATYQLGVTTSLANGNVSLSGFTGGALDGETSFVAGQIDWTISDALSLNVGLSQLNAQSGSLLAPLDGTRSITLGATYYLR
jgi:hypothetical protein